MEQPKNDSFYHFKITKEKMEMAKKTARKMSIRYFTIAIFFGFLCETALIKMGVCDLTRRVHAHQIGSPTTRLANQTTSGWRI
jgi:hypothetical protein